MQNKKLTLQIVSVWISLSCNIWYKLGNVCVCVRVRACMSMYACMCMWKSKRPMLSMAGQELAKGKVVGRV
jgi:hypothetical protein